MLSLPAEVEEQVGNLTVSPRPHKRLRLLEVHRNTLEELALYCTCALDSTDQIKHSTCQLLEGSH